MKNILFHSGEFWFNATGFPKKPGELRYDYEEAEYQQALKDYERDLQLALADSVKFADNESIFQKLYDNNLLLIYPVEGRTFFIEGIEVQVTEKKVWFLEHIMSRSWVIQNNTAGFLWTNIATEATQFNTAEEAQRYDDESSERGKELNAYPTEHIFISKVAVLSNSPVKSETLEEAVYLKGFYTKANLQSFVDGFEPKAEPTVEGEWRIHDDYFLTNGRLQLLLGNPSPQTLKEFQSIAALLNRAPLGEKTKEDSRYKDSEFEVNYAQALILLDECKSVPMNSNLPARIKDFLLNDGQFSPPSNPELWSVLFQLIREGKYELIKRTFTLLSRRSPDKQEKK